MTPRARAGTIDQYGDQDVLCPICLRAVGGIARAGVADPAGIFYLREGWNRKPDSDGINRPTEDARRRAAENKAPRHDRTDTRGRPAPELPVLIECANCGAVSEVVADVLATR